MDSDRTLQEKIMGKFREWGDELETLGAKAGAEAAEAQKQAGQRLGALRGDIEVEAKKWLAELDEQAEKAQGAAKDGLLQLRARVEAARDGLGAELGKMNLGEKADQISDEAREALGIARKQIESAGKEIGEGLEQVFGNVMKTIGGLFKKG
ncbi:MAG: hypothetical protein FJX78_02720 [Armatimonadetes bacterium]|nr:hypothetical protein [Armatimonadota bacterium]